MRSKRQRQTDTDFSASRPASRPKPRNTLNSASRRNSASLVPPVGSWNDNTTARPALSGHGSWHTPPVPPMLVMHFDRSRTRSLCFYQLIQHKRNTPARRSRGAMEKKIRRRARHFGTHNSAYCDSSTFTPHHNTDDTALGGME